MEHNKIDDDAVQPSLGRSGNAILCPETIKGLSPLADQPIPVSQDHSPAIILSEPRACSNDEQLESMSSHATEPNTGKAGSVDPKDVSSVSDSQAITTMEDGCNRDLQAPVKPKILRSDDDSSTKEMVSETNHLACLFAYNVTLAYAGMYLFLHADDALKLSLPLYVPYKNRTTATGTKLTSTKQALVSVVRTIVSFV